VVTQSNLLSSSQTSRDENLRAKLPGGGGRVKEERYAKVEVMRSSLVNRSKSSA
jgi:hypothetical protein